MDQTDVRTLLERLKQEPCLADIIKACDVYIQTGKTDRKLRKALIKVRSRASDAGKDGDEIQMVFIKKGLRDEFTFTEQVEAPLSGGRFRSRSATRTQRKE